MKGTVSLLVAGGGSISGKEFLTLEKRWARRKSFVLPLVVTEGRPQVLWWPSWVSEGDR